MLNLRLQRKNFYAGVISLVFLYCFLFVYSSIIHAQTVDPTEWQNNAVGLKTSSNSYKKTAGLTFGVTLSSQTAWPNLSLQGGVQEGWGKLMGPVGVDLGQILIPDTSASTSSELANWSSDEISLNSGALKVHASRLSPALLTFSEANKLQLFTGNVRKYSLNGTTVVNEVAGPSYPKYIAYSSGGAIQVKPLSGNSIEIPALDNNWILVWYGNNSHFVDTKKPLTYSHGMLPYRGTDITVPMDQAYLADAPMLLTFQNTPSSINQPSGGGIELTFATSPGYMSVLPLYGREHLNATQTDSWGSTQTLPSDLQTKVNFWTQRACQFPVGVSESYSYDPALDSANISEAFNFLTVCNTSTAKFALLPPMLAVAKNTFGSSLTFSQPVIDGNIPTEFGPIMGIDNASSYTWSVKGMKKYTDARRVIQTGSPSAELVQELTNYTDRLTTTGHLSPWIFADGLVNSDLLGRVYFNNPADIIYSLSEVVPVLPEPQKTNLINYIKSERSSYPPETVFNLTLSGDTPRDFYGRNPNTNVVGGTTIDALWSSARPDQSLKWVPLFNFLSLSRYYDLTGEVVPSTVAGDAVTALNNDLSEQDWATFSPFLGYGQKRTAVEDTNRLFAGLVGATNIFQKTGKVTNESLSRSLLAKAAVARIAMAVYPRYLYSSNLENVTGYSPDWMATQTRGGWYGTIFNFNWTQPTDDIRQVVRQNQFETVLYDHTGYGNPNEEQQTWIFDITASSLSPFLDITPELGRLLGDYAKNESLTYINKVQELIPNWNLSFADAVLGAEHSRNYPTDAYQLFMAKSLIAGESAENLEKKLDIPWLMNGDFFYMDKAAEVIKDYRGWTWSDQVVSPTPTPTPTSTPTPTPTPTPTQIPTPTSTPSPTPSNFGSIQGVVKNASGNAVANTSVTISSGPTTGSTLTDASGFYQLPNLASGNYSLSYNKSACGNIKIQSVPVTSGQIQIQDIKFTNKNCR